jgi:hypothetical protein
LTRNSVIPAYYPVKSSKATSCKATGKLSQRPSFFFGRENRVYLRNFAIRFSGKVIKLSLKYTFRVIRPYSQVGLKIALNAPSIPPSEPIVGQTRLCFANFRPSLVLANA